MDKAGEETDTQKNRDDVAINNIGMETSSLLDSSLGAESNHPTLSILWEYGGRLDIYIYMCPPLIITSQYPKLQNEL